MVGGRHSSCGPVEIELSGLVFVLRAVSDSSLCEYIQLVNVT